MWECFEITVHYFNVSEHLGGKAVFLVTCMATNMRVGVHFSVVTVVSRVER